LELQKTLEQNKEGKKH